MIILIGSAVSAFELICTLATVNCILLINCYCYKAVSAICKRKHIP